jgi:hypothetical protein
MENKTVFVRGFSMPAVGAHIVQGALDSLTVGCARQGCRRGGQAGRRAKDRQVFQMKTRSPARSGKMGE